MIDGGRLTHGWRRTVDRDGRRRKARVSECAPIVVVLTEQVSDSHLAGLRADGVSYIFAGRTSLDLARALDVFEIEFGVRRLILEGGGVANGAFLRAGLVDEISLIIWPAVDGAAGVPTVFDSAPADANQAAPLASMRLLSCERMDDDAIWLRYQVRAT
jgi:riboflavin biosynthesis pyrimidine reductase